MSNDDREFVFQPKSTRIEYPHGSAFPPEWLEHRIIELQRELKQAQERIESLEQLTQLIINRMPPY